MLVDSHAHLELDSFDRDRDAVIGRARTAGVAIIITVGIDLEDSRKAVDLARRYRDVRATVGVHPHQAKVVTPAQYDELRALAAEEGVVAYGEIGLDFFKNYSPREQQIRRFGEQLDLCRDLGLPVIVHDRDAHNEIIAMLAEHRGVLTGVIHCFSGDYAVARRCLDLGYCLSIPGTVTYPMADELREVVRKVPLDRLMVETDAPFLAPEPLRGRRNEPSFVIHTVRKIAEIRGIDIEEAARRTGENALNLFRISLQDAGTAAQAPRSVAPRND